MDPTANRDNLFSRGPSPPPQQQHFQAASAQLADTTVSSPPTVREANASAAQSALDSLFHNLSAAQSPPVGPQPATLPTSIHAGPQDVPHSGPATPASVNAGSVSSSHSGPSNTTADRQNALLSLLGAVTSPSSSSSQIPPMIGPMPQQVPTPPGSAPRIGQSSNEQTKFLLDQLMSGAPKYNNDPQPTTSYPPTGSAGPSPTYLPSNVDSQSQSQSQGEFYSAPGSFDANEPPQTSDLPEMPPLSQSDQQRPPSPSRRSMFDFVSPFDALNSPPTQAKRKPVPAQPSITGTSDDSSWSNLAMDPKRKSVENLMDQITRGQGPLTPPTQAVTAQFDPYAYAPSDDLPTPQAEQGQAKAPRPLPPQPSGQAGSPRASPPKVAAQARAQQRSSVDSPIGPPAPQGSYYQAPRKEKESNNPFRPMVASNKNVGLKGKTSSQTIVFDVAAGLEEVRAPAEAVKSTAIALVKVDSTFLPGTTIGATHWVAYAMTKGRVRVISRSSGDRTLLQLPQLFPTSVAVSDMSVHGNRLAGVTSDGGFVVWELPEVIRDDVLGKVVLCVLPSQDLDPLHAVKWHPQHPDLVAVTSESNLYLVNIEDAHHSFGGEPIPQSELHRVSQIFTIPTSIIAFDFDVSRSAIAVISDDSTLTMWNIRDPKLPFWSQKIRGEDMPSSLTFVDGGVVIGRKNGTVFQLLNVMSSNVLSTIKFVNGHGEDPDMFGHANYDSRIQTLWIANNRRESMIAFKINFDVSTPSPGGDEGRGAFFDQVVEFVGPKPTIHFVILTADADPHGKEAHAACVAAKMPPGELALVAFSVHSSGVDQVLIRKEWYDNAFAVTPSKLPLFNSRSAPAPEPKQQLPPAAPYSLTPQGPPQPQAAAIPPRSKTPPSEDVEAVDSRDEGRVMEPKGKGQKGRKTNDGALQGAEPKGKGLDTSGSGADTPLASALTKEIRKVEENLHTRIGRLIGKELDKQHQRLEDARANEQAADFIRQEKILKLISTELTKNTTRVVEMAVKAEVQQSVLPALENITKTEVKAALNNQISKGLAESMKQNLPNEIERLLLRPDVSNHIARTFSGAVTPLVEKHVKDAITKTLIPAYSQQSSSMHQELSREIHGEILNLKKEIVTWQSEALRGQESVIRDLEQSVRLLSDQIKYLTMNVGPPSQLNMQPVQRGSPAQMQPSQLNQSNLLRHQNLPPVQQQQQQPASSYAPQHNPFPQQQQQQQQQQGPPPPMQHGPWFTPTNIAAPQASHPVAPPPAPQQVNRTPPLVQPEEWDDTYLAVLGTQDTRQLRELLARSNPEIVMPTTGSGPLSQAVVLTLVHRLSQIIGETPPVDESFKSSLWWLQRAASTLNTNDPLISPYVSRVLPSVQQMLNTTKQRMAILPGGPLMPDSARTISDVQDMLARKPM